MLLNALSMAPFVPLFIFAWIRASRGIWDAWTWAAMGIFLAGAVLGLFWQYRRHIRMRCPDCGRPILPENKITAAPGAPLDFYCPRCDVVWKTGLREPTD